MQPFRRVFVMLTCALTMSVTSPSLCAQTPKNDTEDLADQIASVIADTRPQQVLVAPLDGCLFDEQICAAYDASVRVSVGRKFPNAGFVSREELSAAVKRDGFLGLDVYNGDLLVRIAAELKAEILVTEPLNWVPDGYELVSEVIDTHTQKSLIQLKLTGISRSTPDSGDDPLVIIDPHSGISLVLFKKKYAGFPVFRLYKCEKCPTAPYSEEARKKRIEGQVVLVFTITEQGVSEDIRVVKRLDPELDAASMKAVRSWHLSPAIGFDGKPFAVRTHAEMTFRLL